MEQYDLIVTYNGAAFDVPWIEEHFGKILSQTAHVDLRFPLRRLGFLGGLKAIEYQAGLSRARELSGVQGADAVALWHRWWQGDRDARETLIRYNEADVASLPVLADIAYSRLTSQLPIETAPLEPWTKLDKVPQRPSGVRREDGVNGWAIGARRLCRLEGGDRCADREPLSVSLSGSRLHPISQSKR